MGKTLDELLKEATDAIDKQLEEDIAGEDALNEELLIDSVTDS